MPDDPLKSWRDGPTKSAILDFVFRVTSEDTPDFVPPTERIATFDNDGTLWPEQPTCVQFLFTLDRVKALAATAPRMEDDTTIPSGPRREGDFPCGVG